MVADGVMRNGADRDRRRVLALLNGAEVYQDVDLNGQTLLEGTRGQCAERYDVIARRIAPSDTVLDVGSNLGYFAGRLARERRASVVVSLEAAGAYVRAQRFLHAAHGLDNLVLVQGRLSLDWLRTVSDSCLVFDHVLLLSVLHHFRASDVQEVCVRLGRLARSLIVEISHPDEQGSCGAETRDVLTLDNLREWFGKERVCELGRFPTHTDAGLTRPCVQFEDRRFVREGTRPHALWEGDVFRTTRTYRLATEVGADDTRVRSIERAYGPETSQRESVERFGVALCDVSLLGPIVHPSRRTLLAQLHRAGTDVGTDSVPWNYLYGPDGLYRIDIGDSVLPERNRRRLARWVSALSAGTWNEAYRQEWANDRRRFILPRQPFRARLRGAIHRVRVRITGDR